MKEKSFLLLFLILYSSCFSSAEKKFSSPYPLISKRETSLPLLVEQLEKIFISHPKEITIFKDSISNQFLTELDHSFHYPIDHQKLKDFLFKFLSTPILSESTSAIPDHFSLEQEITLVSSSQKKSFRIFYSKRKKQWLMSSGSLSWIIHDDSFPLKHFRVYSFLQKNFTWCRQSIDKDPSFKNLSSHLQQLISPIYLPFPMTKSHLQKSSATKWKELSFFQQQCTITIWKDKTTFYLSFQGDSLQDSFAPLAKNFIFTSSNVLTTRLREHYKLP